MEVTTLDSHVTHAVIGGGAMTSFGVSQNASFVQTLSATLYSNQILAVARETICNHWDAHIASGRTHIPIEITLSETQLVIRDFGLGIPKDMVGPVYCVYGNSTKTNDGEQTGGFGLGCKSPFAYVEHFEFSNCHEGIKTIYRASKSANEANGMPSLTEIVSVPTTDTGVIETIAIKSAEDYRTFRKYFKKIAYGGNMKVKFNGELLPTYGEGIQGDTWFIMEGEKLYTAPRPTVLNIRYGNVIYPAPLHEHYAEIYSKVLSFFEKINQRNSDPRYVLVLQAKPNSITVTPSRETLSMNSRTIQTVRELLEAFRENLNKDLDGDKLKVYLEDLDNAQKSTVGMPLFQNTRGVLLGHRIKQVDRIRSIPDMAVELVRHGEELARKQHQEVILRRLDMIEALPGTPQGSVEQLRKIFLTRAARKIGKDLSHRQIRALNCKEMARVWHSVNGRVHTALYLHEKLDHKKYFVMPLDTWRYSEPVQYAKCNVPQDVVEMLPYLRKIVVISRSAKGALRRTNSVGTPFSSFGEYGNCGAICYYEVSANKELQQQAIELFQKHGFTVVNMINRQDWEPPIERKIVDPSLPKAPPRPKGMPRLDNLGNGQTNNIFWTDSADRHPEDFVPEFYYAPARLKNVMDSRDICPFDKELSAGILKEWGSVGAVAYTPAQQKRARDKNWLDVEQFVIKQLMDGCEQSPDLLYFVANNPAMISHAADHYNMKPGASNSLIPYLMRLDAVIQKFRPGVVLTDKQQLLLQISDWAWEYGALELSRFKDLASKNGQTAAQFKLMLSSSLDKEYKKEILRLKSERIFYNLETHRVVRSFDHDADAETRDKMIQTLTYMVQL